MSKNKPYEQQMPEHQALNEAAMICEASSRNVEDFCVPVPMELMQKLAEYAIEECEAGRCIPHEQVKAALKERMGWR